ncbi:MAG: hypothetical protein ACU0CO_14740 [Shimia sp.]
MTARLAPLLAVAFVSACASMEATGSRGAPSVGASTPDGLPAQGTPRAEVAARLGPPGDTVASGGGATCVTFPGQGGATGFVHAFFRDGRLERITEANVVTCAGGFD